MAIAAVALTKQLGWLADENNKHLEDTETDFNIGEAEKCQEEKINQLLFTVYYRAIQHRVYFDRQDNQILRNRRELTTASGSALNIFMLQNDVPQHTPSWFNYKEVLAPKLMERAERCTTKKKHSIWGIFGIIGSDPAQYDSNRGLPQVGTPTLAAELDKEYVSELKKAKLHTRVGPVRDVIHRMEKYDKAPDSENGSQIKAYVIKNTYQMTRELNGDRTFMNIAIWNHNWNRKL